MYLCSGASSAVWQLLWLTGMILMVVRQAAALIMVVISADFDGSGHLFGRLVVVRQTAWFCALVVVWLTTVVLVIVWQTAWFCALVVVWLTTVVLVIV
jgi:hypothetical protein